MLHADSEGNCPGDKVLALVMKNLHRSAVPVTFCNSDFDDQYFNGHNFNGHSFDDLDFDYHDFIDHDFDDHDFDYPNVNDHYHDVSGIAGQ